MHLSFSKCYPRVNSEKPRQQMGKVSWGFGPKHVVNKPKCLACNRNGNFWVRYFLQYLYLHAIWLFTLILMGIITCRETTFLCPETHTNVFHCWLYFSEWTFLIYYFSDRQRSQPCHSNTTLLTTLRKISILKGNSWWVTTVMGTINSIRVSLHPNFSNKINSG